MEKLHDINFKSNPIEQRQTINVAFNDKLCAIMRSKDEYMSGTQTK